MSDPERPITAANVVIFGYDELLFSSLKIAGKNGANISGVVFPANRIKDPRVIQIKDSVSAKGHRVFVQPPKRENSPFAKELRLIDPDLMLIWSYPMILPKAIVEIPRLGSINVHMGLLPQYRGANGIQRALINGEAKTGVTLHYMDSGVDTGPMIARGDYPITAEDDIISLMIKSKYAGEVLLDRLWRDIVTGKAPRMKQDESQADYFGPLRKKDRKIDWNRSASEIHNLIRALAFPFPGAFTFWKGEKFIIRKAKYSDSDCGTTDLGCVTNVGSEGIQVSTSNGCLLIQEAEVNKNKFTSNNFGKLDIKIGDGMKNS